MTPQHYAKLSAQATRQTAERDALLAQAAAMQSNIDDAQQWADSAQASVDAAEAALTEAREAEGADVATAQAAVDAAQAALSTAKASLSQQTGGKVSLTSQASYINAQILTCQAEMVSSGLNLTPQQLTDVYNAAIAARAAEKAQADADALARSAAKVDNVIAYLVSHTPAEIEAKVAADVTNIATAKTYIAGLAKAVAVLARRELR